MPSQTPNVKPSSDLEQNQELPAYDVYHIINWRKVKFFTVMDIPNAPLRKLILEEFKKVNNGALIKENQKENPFSAPYNATNFHKEKESGNIESLNEMGKREEQETEGLVSKNEEEKLNPFTN